jgi:hypothetical protein
MILALGILLGVLLLAICSAGVICLLGSDPPAEMPELLPENNNVRAALFRPTPWKRIRPNGVEHASREGSSASDQSNEAD